MKATVVLVEGMSFYLKESSAASGGCIAGLPLFDCRHLVGWPRAPRQVSDYDFMHDSCDNDQKTKCLTAIDEFTKVRQVIDVPGTLPSGRVAEVLSPLVSAHGAPRYVQFNKGPALVSWPIATVNSALHHN